MNTGGGLPDIRPEQRETPHSPFLVGIGPTTCPLAPGAFPRNSKDVFGFLFPPKSDPAGDRKGPTSLGGGGVFRLSADERQGGRCSPKNAAAWRHLRPLETGSTPHPSPAQTPVFPPFVVSSAGIRPKDIFFSIEVTEEE